MSAGPNVRAAVRRRIQSARGAAIRLRTLSEYHSGRVRQQPRSLLLLVTGGLAGWVKRMRLAGFGQGKAIANFEISPPGLGLRPFKETPVVCRVEPFLSYLRNLSARIRIVPAHSNGNIGHARHRPKPSSCLDKLSSGASGQTDC
jgi:hypothetical protein